MQAHELLVGHMRLHKFQGLRLSAVGLFGVRFKDQPPGLMFGLFPATVGLNPKGSRCILVPSQTPESEFHDRIDSETGEGGSRKGFHLESLKSHEL